MCIFKLWRFESYWPCVIAELEIWSSVNRTQIFIIWKYTSTKDHLKILKVIGWKSVVLQKIRGGKNQRHSWNAQLRPPVTQPKTPSTPLCHTYSEPLGCEDSPGGIQNIPYLYKKLSKSRFSDPFFWRFLVISGLGSRIYIVKSAILSFWVFLSTFLHEITL